MKLSFKTLLIGLTLFAGVALPKVANADCTSLYGGGQSCPPSFNFNIEKTVLVPGKGGGNYTGNLSINDAKYSPSQIVKFHIVVTNTGNDTIPTITVTDRLPDFLTFVAGPGSYDTNTKTITYTVNGLGAGKSTDAAEIDAKIADSNMLPSDKGIVCLVNRATGTDSNGVTDSSDSQFCIEKQVLGVVLPAPKVVNTPATGAETLTLLGLIPAALAGFTLRKKSIKI